MIEKYDGIHDCKNCGFNPCSLQPIVENNCEGCPIPTRCCHAPIIPLLPCERGHYEEGPLGIKLVKYKGIEYCYAFDPVLLRCTIYDTRPLACRIASCGFIRRKQIKEIKT